MFLISAGNIVGHVVDKTIDAAGNVLDAAGTLNVINKLPLIQHLDDPLESFKTLYIHRHRDYSS